MTRARCFHSIDSVHRTAVQRLRRARLKTGPEAVTIRGFQRLLVLEADLCHSRVWVS